MQLIHAEYINLQKKKTKYIFYVLQFSLNTYCYKKYNIIQMHKIVYSKVAIKISSTL